MKPRYSKGKVWYDIPGRGQFNPLAPVKGYFDKTSSVSESKFIILLLFSDKLSY